MDTIKPIETEYKNYRFRSRLEARWAVFFDALGVEWEYEKEGFELSNGEKYLPDFWIKRPECWIEIKPDNFNDNGSEKAGLLAAKTRQWVNVICGNPWLDEHRIYAYHHAYPDEGLKKYLDIAIQNDDRWVVGKLGAGYCLTEYQSVFTEKGWKGYDIKPYRKNDRVLCFCEKHQTLSFGWRAYIPSLCETCSRPTGEIEEISPFMRCFDGETEPDYNCGDGDLLENQSILNAYKAARSARFEFGESGSPMAPAAAGKR
jgi:hypothetical protein